MKESIGGTWLFGIFITFLLLIAGFLCFAINYTKAFKVKDQIINIIERNGGINYKAKEDASLKEINNYITNDVGYRTLGECPEGYNGYLSNDTATNLKQESFYCIKEVKVNEKAELNMVYYKILVFFKFDVPVLNSFLDLNFTVKGSTKYIEKKLES